MRLYRYPGLFGEERSRGLWAALAASALLHAGLLAAFGRFRIAPPERTFFAPIHMVELAPKGIPQGDKAPAGPPAAAPKPAPAPPKPAPAPKPSSPPAAVKPAPKQAPKPAPPPPREASRDAVGLAPSREPPAPREEFLEERLAERLKRIREQVSRTETAPAGPKSPPAAPGTDSDVRRAVESIRGRIQPPTGAAGAGTPAGSETGAVGIRGTAGNVLQEVRLRAYYNRLWEHVNSYWAIPPSLDGKGYTVIVSVALDRRGRLLRSAVEQSSGSEAFDQSALRALVRASPLPPFPEEIAGDALEVGFRFHGE